MNIKQKICYMHNCTLHECTKYWLTWTDQLFNGKFFQILQASLPNPTVHHGKLRYSWGIQFIWKQIDKFLDYSKYDNICQTAYQMLKNRWLYLISQMFLCYSKVLPTAEVVVYFRRSAILSESLANLDVNWRTKVITGWYQIPQILWKNVKILQKLVNLVASKKPWSIVRKVNKRLTWSHLCSSVSSSVDLTLNAKSSKLG